MVGRDILLPLGSGEIPGFPSSPMGAGVEWGAEHGRHLVTTGKYGNRLPIQTLVNLGMGGTIFAGVLQE